MLSHFGPSVSHSGPSCPMRAWLISDLPGDFDTDLSRYRSCRRGVTSLLCCHRDWRVRPSPCRILVGVPHARDPLHTQLKNGFVAAAARHPLAGARGMAHDDDH
jgi:hypothetical protein